MMNEGPRKNEHTCNGGKGGKYFNLIVKSKLSAMKILFISFFLFVGFVMCNSKDQQAINTVDNVKPCRKKIKI
jgi:hypothetical protein